MMNIIYHLKIRNYVWLMFTYRKQFINAHNVLPTSEEKIIRVPKNFPVTKLFVILMSVFSKENEHDLIKITRT